ncbi:MAG: hypothetical protein WC223_01370 [Bacteroidales bacterium]|jgi:hypothetical protein
MKRINLNLNKMNILNGFIYISLLINTSCNDLENKKQPPKDDKINSSYSLTEIDSIYKKIIKNCDIWVKSWKDVSNNFDITKFKFENKDSCKSCGNWDKYIVDNDFLALYNDILFYSFNKSMIVDIYSNKTILTKKENRLIATFDADTKVYVIDLNNKKSKLLFTSGTIEMYNDCLWIDSDNFALLGSRSEYVNNIESFRPFIWIYNIKNNVYNIYSDSKTYQKYNTGYFFNRFKNISDK